MQLHVLVPRRTDSHHRLHVLPHKEAPSRELDLQLEVPIYTSVSGDSLELYAVHQGALLCTMRRNLLRLLDPLRL